MGLVFRPKKRYIIDRIRFKDWLGTLEDLQAQIDAEEAARIDADEDLQDQIDDLVGEDFQAQIDAEIAARIAGDAAEEAARIAADDAEEAARIAGDAATLASAQSYADGLVTGLWDDRGNFDASVNAYPSSGGSGVAGAIKKGDIWTVSVAGTLPTGQVVEPGDTVRALIDAPGNTQANWAIAQNNVGYVPENQVNKATGTGAFADSDTSYPSEKKVKANNDLKQDTITGAASTAVSSNFTTNKIVRSNEAGKLEATTISPEDLGVDQSIRVTEVLIAQVMSLALKEIIANDETKTAIAGANGSRIYAIYIGKYDVTGNSYVSITSGGDEYKLIDNSILTPEEPRKNFVNLTEFPGTPVEASNGAIAGAPFIPVGNGATITVHSEGADDLMRVVYVDLE